MTNPKTKMIMPQWHFQHDLVLSILRAQNSTKLAISAGIVSFFGRNRDYSIYQLSQETDLSEKLMVRIVKGVVPELETLAGMAAATGRTLGDVFAPDAFKALNSLAKSCQSIQEHLDLVYAGAYALQREGDPRGEQLIKLLPSWARAMRTAAQSAHQFQETQNRRRSSRPVTILEEVVSGDPDLEILFESLGHYSAIARTE